jgi:hypothetical protein
LNMVTWFPPSTSPKSACRRLPNFDPQPNCEWKDTDLSLEMLWADSSRFQSRDAGEFLFAHWSLVGPYQCYQCQPCQVIPTLIIAGNEVESLQVPIWYPFEQISWIRWRCFFILQWEIYYLGNLWELFFFFRASFSKSIWSIPGII